jgi:PAS domain S-box-containing protein
MEQLAFQATLLDNISDAVTVADNQHILTVWNQAAEKIFGWQAADVLGRPEQEVFRTDFIGIDRADVFRRVSETGRFCGEAIQNHRNGTPIRVEVNIFPTRNEEGEITGHVTVSREIKKCEPAETALRESETQYRLLMANSLDAILLTSPDGAIFKANRAACAMFGYTEDELRGLGRQGVIDVTDPGLAPALAERARTGRFHGELTLVRRDGSKFPVEISSMIYKDGSGKTMTSMVIRDISARLRSESALRSKEAHLQLAQRVAHLGSWEWNPKTKSVEWSDEMFDIFQINREEFNKDPAIIGDRIHPDDRDSYLYTVRATLEHGMPLSQPLEFRVILPDGAIRYLVLITPAPQIGDGTTGPITGVVQDITERKRSEQLVANAYRYNRTIIEFSPVGIITCTASGKVISANPAAVQITGGTIERVLQQNVFQLDSWKKSGMLTAAEEALKSGREKRIEAKAVSSYGKDLALDCRFVPFEYEGNRRLLALFTDIADCKRAEEAARKSQEELRLLAAHANTIREEEQKRLAREFHDRLGQNMTALKIDLSLLLRLFLDESRQLSRPDIARELESACRLVDDTIRITQEIIAELRSGMLEDLGLIAALEWETKRFQSRTGISCRFTADPDDIQLDYRKSIVLFRICQEALTNIVRHARATGVSVALLRVENRLIFEIRDNGRGMTGEERSTAKAFGLIGMRERAMALGGTFSITSRAGEGTTVRVTLASPQSPAPEKGRP